jgi:hypothetical protein
MKNIFVAVLLLTITALLFLPKAKQLAKRTTTRKYNASQLQSTTSNVNYLTHKYTLLDSNFKIIVSDSIFNIALNKFGFKTHLIKTYSDSLQVVLMLELQDWAKMRTAHLQITYTIERVQRHLLIDTVQYANYLQQWGYKHPYQVLRRCKDDAIQDPLKNKIFANLKSQLIAKGFKDSLVGLNNWQLMKFSFHYHPQTIDALEHTHHY